MKNRLQNILDNVQLSAQDSERIINDCLKVRHVNNKVFLYSGRIVAAIVVVIMATTSVTAYAAVSAYQAYMERMNKEEVQERYENVYEGTRGWTLYTRELTQDEQLRMNALQEDYMAGIRFPEQSMPYFNGEEETVPTEAELSFDYVNEICYIPERELTDEELLQIIDLYEKANYSLQEVREEIGEDTLETPVITPAPVTPQDWGLAESDALAEEEWIDQLSKSAFGELTGGEAALVEWKISIHGDAEAGGEYWYLSEFESEAMSGNICYIYDETTEKWIVKRYTRFVEESFDMSVDAYSEEEIQQKISAICEDATHKLKDVFGVTDKIVKGEHDYGYNSKLLQVVLTTENGNRYRLYYIISTEQIRDYSIYSAERWEDFTIIEEAYVTEFEATE